MYLWTLEDEYPQQSPSLRIGHLGIPGKPGENLEFPGTPIKPKPMAIRVRISGNLVIFFFRILFYKDLDIFSSKAHQNI